MREGCEGGGGGGADMIVPERRVPGPGETAAATFRPTTGPSRASIATWASGSGRISTPPRPRN